MATRVRSVLGWSARSPPQRRRGSAVGATIALVLAVAFALGGSYVPGARSPGRGGPVPAPTIVGGGAYGAFALRAGFSPVYAYETTDPHPATGSVRFEVTFAAPLALAERTSVLAYFHAYGLELTSGSAGGSVSIGLAGSAASVSRAFGTRLIAGVHAGGPVLYPAIAPSVPDWLDREIAGVVGLSEGFTPFSFDLAPLGRASLTGPSTTPSDLNTVTPDLARQFYDFGTLTDLGGKETYPTNLSIAVVLWGNGPSPNDLSTFFNDSSEYPSSLPKPTLHAYPVDGAPRPSPTAPDRANALSVEELTLDTEWAASMAPGATIDIVYAPNGPAPSYSPSTKDLTAAVQKAVALDPDVISMSFGAPEASAGSLISAWTPLFTQAQGNNTTIIAATGDTGGDSSFNNSVCSGTPSPDFPASDPQVLGVGGTNVSVHLGTGSGYSESGWVGSGGGFSGRFGAPTWQTQTVGAIRTNGHRGIPDVSASAADDFVYFNSSSQMARGTSFATPLWAGLVADIDAKWGHRLGFFTPSLYHVGLVERSGEIGSGLADITSGGNCVAQATSGWDAVTGWGSPHAPVLYDDLLGSFVTIDLQLGATVVGPGGTLSVSAHVTNRTSGAPIGGVPVNLSISADTDLGPCTGGQGRIFETQFPVTDPYGWVSGTLRVPACYLGQHAIVNASVTTTKYYGTSGARVGVNLLGFLPQLEFLSQSPYVFLTYAVIVGTACVVGAWLGRPREPAVGPRGAGAEPPPVPPSPAAPTPPRASVPSAPGKGTPGAPAPPGPPGVTPGPPAGPPPTVP